MSKKSPKLLLAGFLLIALVNLAGPVCGQAPARETWYGVLETDARHFRFLLQIDEAATGQTGKLISLDEGNSEFALDELVKTGEQLSFKISVSSAVYQAKLDAQAGVMQGTWAQRGGEFPLSFKPVDGRPETEYEAIWLGELKGLLQTLEVQFRELDSGLVYFDSISQGAGGFVGKKAVDGLDITFSVPGVRGEFKGVLAEDGKSIKGKWSQGLTTIDLVLELAVVEATPDPMQPPARPQTPEPPFPYDVEEVVFENAEAGIKLAGTLTLPQTADQNPVPAVVLISGSGPQDRDETIMHHKPFWVIADFLSRHGIAVLRFDERGVGESTGDFSQATSADFADDVEAAVGFLSNHSRIHPAKIGLCGHSEGGLVAPMVAIRDKANIAFIVMLAGPGVNGRRILESQSKLILEKSGVTEDEIDRQRQLQAAFIDLALQQPSLTEAEFIESGRQAVEELLTDRERGNDADKAMVEVAARQLLNPWMRYFLEYEPAEALQKVRCPVLALNGEKDLQVDPRLNLPAIRSALASAGNDQVTIQELANLNHMFQNAKTGLIHEYERIEETFDPGALKLMADWIQSAAK